ncbi:MAG: T9SS type A sorting domain-containing protein [Bacteroidota bacterium]|nr:T9SS type A sorting domain-containing protein [Bacteroidota bacterium]
MKKLLLSGVIALFAAGTANAQTTIAAARSMSTSITASSAPTVSIKGVVINGAELGSIRYIQDATGGMAVFSSTANASINRGDTVTVTGPMVGRYGTLQVATTSLNPAPLVVTKTSSAGVLPAPQVLTNSQFFTTATAEPTESSLVRINGGTFQQTGNFSYGTSGMSYTVNYASGNFVVCRITATANPLVGTPIPTGVVDIIGVTGQFCGAVDGYTCISGYQIIPRDLNDIIPSTVGLSEATKNVTSLSVYPNPSSSIINFNVSNGEIVKSTQITDLTGRVIFSSNENATLINVNTLSNGIYHLTVSTNKQNYQAKVTVAK